jgi:hypothetical protein
MSLTESMDKFHAHLDECKQCREHPFGLCPSGSTLLLATADDGMKFGKERPLDGTEKVG